MCIVHKGIRSRVASGVIVTIVNQIGINKYL